MPLPQPSTAFVPSLAARDACIQYEFDVLSDAGNAVARQFGLVYTLPGELRDALTSNAKALPPINGDDSGELPVDYRRRLMPERILEALSGLKAA